MGQRYLIVSNIPIEWYKPEHLGQSSNLIHQPTVRRPFISHFHRFRKAAESDSFPPGEAKGVLTFSVYALVGVGEYVDPAQAPRWGALRCGRILSAPTVQVGRLASFSQPLCPISWRVHPGAFWKPGLRASVAAPMESAQHKRTAARFLSLRQLAVITGQPVPAGQES